MERVHEAKLKKEELQSLRDQSEYLCPVYSGLQSSGFWIDWIIEVVRLHIRLRILFTGKGGAF